MCNSGFTLGLENGTRKQVTTYCVFNYECLPPHKKKKTCCKWFNSQRRFSSFWINFFKESVASFLRCIWSNDGSNLLAVLPLFFKVLSSLKQFIVTIKTSAKIAFSFSVVNIYARLPFKRGQVNIQVILFGISQNAP